MQQPPAVRILIVDDHAVFRQPIAHILSAGFGFHVTDCGTPDEAVRALGASAYDLVLLDFDLGNETATTVIPQIRRAGYNGRILILSAGVTEYAALRLAAEGVCGNDLKRTRYTYSSTESEPHFVVSPARNRSMKPSCLRNPVRASAHEMPGRTCPLANARYCAASRAGKRTKRLRRSVVFQRMQ